MANVAIFDVNTKRVLRYLKSVNTPEYSSRNDVIVNPIIETTNIHLSKVIDDKIVDLTEEEVIEVKKQDELINYAQYRTAAYGSIGEQLDMIYHQGLDAWKAHIEAVKIRYPK